MVSLGVITCAEHASSMPVCSTRSLFYSLSIAIISVPPPTVSPAAQTQGEWLRMRVDS